MLKNHGKCLLVLAGLYAYPAFSADNTPLLDSHNDLLSFVKSSFVVTFSAGAAWQNAGQAQTLTLAPDIQKVYTANNLQTTMAQYDLFLGIQKSLSEKALAQIGLDMGVARPASLTGDIWDDADPQFDNYTYRYLVQHSQIALKGKLLGDLGLPVLPWISLTLGAGFNQSSHFYNTPSIYEAVQSPNFSTQTITAFTYAIGIGLEHNIVKHWQIGAGYEFADWGKSSLGSAAGSTTNQTLSLSHLYTNAVMLNLTYLA